ncbi:MULTISPECIES: DUF397 domain-containing protein [Streptomyces]|uniref:DUF397 domain-containing protein n=1 Tax=Streptomyces TaxID=1883 RepID=UPI000DA62FF3|nr:DUF397 domain-containing protein [Streptomyces sp. SID7805]MYU54973.1 DUF397 domain-containing protein [Streptomyces sp. SID7805]
MASVRVDLSDATWRKSTYSNGSGGLCIEVAEGFVGAATWRKSSYSNSSGGNCIEIAQEFAGAARWRKSSYSNADGADCVEVADDIPGIVPVRDSKNPDGPALVIPAAAWNSFVTAVKTGAANGFHRS